MKREIICLECHAKRTPLCPEDIAAGIMIRFATGKAKKPEVHQIKTSVGDSLETLKLVEIEDLPTIRCDHCNQPIPDGTECVAITQWRMGREPEPDNWEPEFFQP